MQEYYIVSVIEEIAKEIENLIQRNIISHEKKIVLYGLDIYSFAMRTILSNLGYQIDSYISDDELKLIEIRRKIKGFAARYFNSKRDAINVFSIKERLLPFDQDVVILIASPTYQQEQMKLSAIGYQENQNSYQVFDFKADAFSQFVCGKREITLPEIKHIEKDMLKYVHVFCEQRKIRYWVCGGTLLGTIRHQGFIPWDDDIDIFMPWKDYQRFADEFKDDNNYKLIVPGKIDRKKYIDFYMKLIDCRTILRESTSILEKVHPVAIDIFPLIGLPEDDDERHVFYRKYSEVDKMIWEDFYAENGNLGVFTKWYAKQKEFWDKYDFDHSKYVGVVGSCYGERDCTTYDVYKQTLQMPFEDIQVNVPIGYKEYLDNLFGNDWMELPDENERVTHHGFEAYWL